MKIHRKFTPQTPLAEAQDDLELERILRLRYPHACCSIETDVRVLADLIEEVQKFSAWRVLGFDSFGAFYDAKIRPQVEGVAWPRMQAILDRVSELRVARPGAAIPASEIPDLRKPGRPTKAEAEDRKADNVSFMHGNQATYLHARIRRDHPEIAVALEAGEYRSVRQAAIAAGIVKVKTPLDQLRHWWKKADNDQRAQFLQECVDASI